MQLTPPTPITPLGSKAKSRWGEGHNFFPRIVHGNVSTDNLVELVALNLPTQPRGWYYKTVESPPLSTCSISRVGNRELALSTTRY